VSVSGKEQQQSQADTIEVVGPFFFQDIFEDIEFDNLVRTFAYYKSDSQGLWVEKTTNTMPKLVCYFASSAYKNKKPIVPKTTGPPFPTLTKHNLVLTSYFDEGRIVCLECNHSNHHTHNEDPAECRMNMPLNITLMGSI
jgi:hypothetical protein